MERRITVLFSIVVLLFSLCVFRIYYVQASAGLATAATVQGRYYLEIAAGRGTVYDRDFSPLVNDRNRYVAAVLPTPQAASELLRVMPEERRASILGQLSGGLPFVTEVPENSIYASGIDIFEVPVRYPEENQLAPHLIGYLGDEGKTGAAGIERAFDAELSDAGPRLEARYQTDASGRTMRGGGVEILRENETGAGGVVLTLKREIQELVQEALLAGCEKGAAVVLDVKSGDILAMASIPAFDQNDVAASLESADSPFINRATSGYNIGSVFKL
ncbi:MAG: hypothetical protein LBU86_07100, partial [Oscillospiraceae bacterium]|nr:hypothetical protein [Oscillospiraceae bacterium]